MATKPAIVTKKQLEESGFDNLRDYLNAERGLTRRDGQVAVRKGEMDIKSPAEKRSATRMADVAAQKPSAERRSDTRLRDSQSASAEADAANMMLVDSNNKDDKQAELMSSYKPRRPDTKLRDVTFDRKTQFSNKALSQMGAETRGPTIGNAKPVVAEGGDRSTRSDNARPVFAPGGNRSVRNLDYENDETKEMKRGGKVKKMASGGMTSSASKRADGIATKGKTRGRMC